MINAVTWMPAAILSMGAVFTLGIDRQKDMALALPIAENVTGLLEGYAGEDLTLSEGEIRVAGVSDYLFREFNYNGGPDAATAASMPVNYSVYVGYYEQQMQGKSIHSPKNCLPGSGWEALGSTLIPVGVYTGQPTQVNRYLLQNGTTRALVLYWYQGRGRAEANEYRVKWDLLVDAALRGRTEEALVRVVVPIPDAPDGENTAEAMALSVAEMILPELYDVLPG